MNIPKFRAWYKVNKKMYDVLTLDIIDKKVLIENNEDKEKPLRGYVKISEVELMQSTGLKDKSGVEIFEGDVVKIEKNICKVEFEEQGVRYVLKNINSERNHLYFNKQSFERCQVIGNIHENPELLEGV